MSADSSDKTAPVVRSRRQAAGRVIGYALWVFASAIIAQLIFVGIFYALRQLGVSFSGSNPAIVNAVLALAVYAITLCIVIGVPWALYRHGTGLRILGFQRLPTWLDIILGPLGIIPYFILSGLLLTAVTQLVPGFDGTQAQEVGFQHITKQYEYLLAFVTLVILAPLAEELLFRGYLYGKLRTVSGVVVATLVTSIVFGALHGQWNVGLDVFALSIVLCLLREKTGSIWAGVLLHATKNGIAFYFLFINPSLLGTL